MSENSVGKSIAEANSKKEVEQSRRYICFGEFYIDQQTQRAFRGSTRLKLSGKPFEILIILIKKHGQIVSRDEIKQVLWSVDAAIDSHSNITTSVNKIRAALQVDSESSCIVTVPRKGYMFDAIPEFLPKPPAKRDEGTEDDSTKTPISIEAGRPAKSLGARTGAGSGLLIVILVLSAVFLGAGLAFFVLAHRGLRLSP